MGSQKRSHASVVICLGLVLGAFQAKSAEVPDDQRSLSIENSAVANPVPMGTDFRANNELHKILIGSLDTGLDYLHPTLRTHVHFTLDAQGNPTGAGYDYIGEDSWPSPYFVRTTGTPREILAMRNHVSEVVATLPVGVRPIFQDRRALSVELDAGSFHGTHVAGLLSYDDPSIGILPYRILPMQAAHELPADLFTNAVERAIRDGAKIISLSLGASYGRPDAGDGEERIVTFEIQSELAGVVRTVMAQHPEILFVGAAGNDGHWIDSRSNFSSPCAVQASNLLCVGALRTDDYPIDFSNLPIVPEIKVVYALGSNVLSTTPTKMCLSAAVPMLEQNLSAILIRQVVSRLGTECSEVGFERMSGTSMSTPIVSRMLAKVWLQNQELTPNQVIDQLLASAREDHVGYVPIKKITTEMPSWYDTASTSTAGPSAGGESSRGARVWEFIVP